MWICLEKNWKISTRIKPPPKPIQHSLDGGAFLLYDTLIHITDMTYEAEVQFKFDATYTHDYTRGFGSTVDDDFIPEEHFVIIAPAADLNAKQYFKLFEKFMLCVGMSPSAIHTGAMSLVFNDYVDEKDQRKVCNEYDLTMNEDLNKKYEEWKESDALWVKMNSHYKNNFGSEPKIKGDIND